MKSILLSAFLIFVFVTRSQAQYWEPLGGGVKGYGGVEALAVDTFNNKLYAASYFDSIGTVKAKNLAAWDGTQWHALPNTPSLPITDLVMKEDTLLYVTGVHNDNQVGMYVDTSFIGLLSPVGISATCIYVFKDTIYIGGEFNGGIKYWNGSQWKKVGDGIDGSFYQVHSIGEYNGELIVGGHFSSAGGVAVNNIAAWNGSEWHVLGDGITGDFFVNVYAIQEFDGDLYVGGTFDTAGGVIAASIAKWNGANWDATSVYGCGTIRGMVNDDGKLYVCGSMLRNIETCMADRAAMFDGANWYDLNLSKGNTCYAITVFNNEVVACGNITEGINNDTINYIGHFLGYPTIAETPEQNSSPIFPNPTSTTITLSLPSNQNAFLSIFNLLGEKVKEEKVTGKEVMMDVSSLPQGLYLVRMENRVMEKPTFVNTTVGKFVKE